MTAPPLLPEIVGNHARARPEAVALAGSDGTAVTWGALAERLARAGALLAGLGREARVACAIPDGPESAATLVAVACHACAVPLPHAPPPAEADRLLAATRPHLLLVRAGDHPAARAAANRAGVPVAEVGPDGALSLASGALGPTGTARAAAPDDLAFLIGTSGTSGAPSLVPRTHRNLVAALSPLLASLDLGPADRCLTLMPLHHSHGLVTAVLGSLLTGGAALVAPASDLPRFWTLLRTWDPTWVTAVPAQFRRVLRTADTGSANPSLRFVRGASDLFAADLRQRLAAAFGVPVVTSYGVSDCPYATVQRLGEPMPDDAVGRPVVDLAILDPDGRLLPPGATGEIAVRGEAVSPAWDPATSRPVPRPAGEWLRTGDLGVLAPDGWLRFVRRERESFRHGGEEVALAAIDTLLRQLPGVADGSAFVVGDSQDEWLGAVLVPQPGAVLSVRAVRRGLLAHLPPSLVPWLLWQAPDLPRTATGKVLRRITDRERLGEPMG